MKDIKDCEAIVNDYLAEHANSEIEEEKNDDASIIQKSSSHEKLDAKMIHSPNMPSLTMSKKNSTVKRKASDDKDRKSQIFNEIKTKSRVSRALVATQAERDKGERQLTPHVVTRFFRAPEVILMDKNYNQKIDVWACGTIL